MPYLPDIFCCVGRVRHVRTYDRLKQTINSSRTPTEFAQLVYTYSHAPPSIVRLVGGTCTVCADNKVVSNLSAVHQLLGQENSVYLGLYHNAMYVTAIHFSRLRTTLLDTQKHPMWLRTFRVRVRMVSSDIHMDAETLRELSISTMIT